MIDHAVEDLFSYITGHSKICKVCFMRDDIRWKMKMLFNEWEATKSRSNRTEKGAKTIVSQLAHQSQGLPQAYALKTQKGKARKGRNTLGF
jgi:hypothetical protein